MLTWKSDLLPWAAFWRNQTFHFEMSVFQLSFYADRISGKIKKKEEKNSEVGRTIEKLDKRKEQSNGNQKTQIETILNNY